MPKEGIPVRLLPQDRAFASMAPRGNIRDLESAGPVRHRFLAGGLDSDEHSGKRCAAPGFDDGSTDR